MSRSRPPTPTTAPRDFYSWADFTDETAERNPDWKIDLCEEVIGGWRGENGDVAAMTLVWGVPMVRGGATATAELAGLTVDQCTATENRFTLLAADAYRGDYLEIALYDGLRRRAGPRVALRGRRRDADRRVAVAVPVAYCITRSTSPYSRACSGVKKRSRSSTSETSSTGRPVCSA